MSEAQFRLGRQLLCQALSLPGRGHDTTLLFVTDGTTWKARTSDLRKLIELQNQGKITRIYTSQMLPELREDLLRLRTEHGLDLKP